MSETATVIDVTTEQPTTPEELKDKAISMNSGNQVFYHKYSDMNGVVIEDEDILLEWSHISGLDDNSGIISVIQNSTDVLISSIVLREATADKLPDSRLTDYFQVFGISICKVI